MLVLSTASLQASDVTVRKVFGPLTLAPGRTGTWFIDNMAQNQVRWFTAVPLGVSEIDGAFASYDQQLEITKVFYILKGEAHARDGTGGQRTLQVNVSVHNIDTAHPATFEIYMAETR